jgi:4-hydroxybenzoate polyprenyltransferase
MSALRLVVAYVRQRARLRLFLPLSTLLAVAGRWMVVSSSASLSDVLIAALQALGLTLAFRVWDDLEDREVDRARHPSRVIASAPTTAPLYALGCALMSAAIISLLAEPFALRRLAALSMAAAILSIWYGARPRDERHHAVAEHVLAIKYPLIAYVVAPDFPADAVTLRIAIVLAVVYVLICVYEYADDVELRQLFTSRRSVS